MNATLTFYQLGIMNIDSCSKLFYFVVAGTDMASTLTRCTWDMQAVETFLLQFHYNKIVNKNQFDSFSKVLLLIQFL